MTEPGESSFERQTSRVLRQRLAELGLRPEVRYGQNFLIDLNLLGLIVDAAEIESDDLVLEVGTGTGGLTTRLAQRAGHVVTVEIDARMVELARATLGATDCVTLLHRDVLKNKHTIDPVVLGTIESLMTEKPLARYKLVANLPYNIATPLISNLLALPRQPGLMVVTIQKELADRLLAEPNSKDYGALSVWVQSLARVRLIRVLPPQVFWPRPKVDSAIVRIDVEPSWRERIPDLAYFHRAVRALFFHRRKLLRKVIQSATKRQLSKSAVDQLLADEGLPPTARTEQLDLATIHRLIEALRRAEASGPRGGDEQA